MTSDEHEAVVQNNKVINAHHRNPKWVRLYDLWRRTWLRAQLAADKRARQRLGRDAD